METSDLNIKFIRSLLQNEIDDYYSKCEVSDMQKDKVNLIRGLLDIFEDKEYLLQGQHFLTTDYKFIINSIGRLYMFLPKIFNYSESKAKNECKKIFESAKTCYAWQENKRLMSMSDFREARKQLLSVLNELKNKYQEERAKYISIRPNHPKTVIFQYEDIFSNLSKWRSINQIQYDILINLFTEKGLPEKDRVILLERIKQHNIRCHKRRKNEYFDVQKSYEIIDIINAGYEFLEIPLIESDRKNEIDANCNILSNLDTDTIIQYLPRYEGGLLFSDGYLKEEFDYYIISMLKLFQDKLFSCAVDLSQEYFYGDKEYRDGIKDEYYKYLKLYNEVRNFYDEQVKSYEEKELDESIPDVRKLSFTSRGYENSKTYFESDLKSVPKDLYSRIKKHLMCFEKDLMPKGYLKPLSELGTGFSEIKDDQVRIVYKHIKDNEYAIMGVFVKKDNNDRIMYRKLSGRDTGGLISGKENEERLFELIDTKKHNGGRKNS